MTRVIAGAARGRRLSVPRGNDVRPTSDRAREGLFSTLEALRGTLAGAHVLDLYAGSGAVGLEALSRGAASVLLVESAGPALRALRDNVRAVGLDGARVRAGSVPGVLAAGSDTAYDVVFADPPYREPLDLAPLVSGGWLAPDAIVVVERSSRDPAWRWPEGIRADRERGYGEATLWYGRRS